YPTPLSINRHLIASVRRVTDRSLPLGVTFASLQGAVSPLDAADVAKRAADLGYRSFWTAEVVGPEAFALLGSVAAQVPSLDLGTGVVALQLRTPPLLAMAAATLQAIVPERDVLVGVGISSLVVAGRWHGAADGVLLNYLPHTHVPWSIEQVRKGGDARVYCYVHVGVTDRERYLGLAQRDLFSYATVDSYAANFTRAGYGDAVNEIRERHAAK